MNYLNWKKERKNKIFVFLKRMETGHKHTRLPKGVLSQVAVVLISLFFLL
jgi:hypothetical protein